MKRALIIIPILLITIGATRRRAVTPPMGPTYNKEIVRILQTHCQSCHHEGDIAPFPLMSYRDAIAHATEIKFMTKARLMPPWKAAAGCGEFAGERTMPQRDIDTIAQWVDNGAPEGNASDLPTPRTFDGGWPLGTPDITLSMSKDFTPPATRDEYRCFSLPLNATNDLNVAAVDYRPGDRATVHHVITYLDPTGASAQLDKTGGGYTCFGGPGLDNAAPLGGWSPGARPTPLPDGIAIRIPKNARAIMQVHYHPMFGKVLPDRTEMGIYLAKGEVRKELHYAVIDNDHFVIPAGAQNYKVEESATLPIDMEIYSVYPHGHLLLQRMNVEAVLPNGDKQCMIQIPAYDFNWQGNYVYKTPLSVPKGAKLHIEGYYDNSTSNFRNPNAPPRDVGFGEASTDEMCLALVGYVSP